ncbi:MAG: HAD family phosphatase [Cohaesibacter sp.]|nr:HAD family phosphatase [Cohaesibacter sp.]
MRPDLVIFDCDGVLVDSEIVSNQVLIDNLAGYGLEMDLAQAMDLFVGGTMRGVEAKARDLGAQLPDERPDQWIDEVYAQTYARLKQGVDVVAGIPQLLDDLDAAGIAYCVASNGSDDKMKITLGQNGLWERFDGKRFSAHSLGVAKPDPDLFLLAAQHMGAKPDHSIVVEDSVNGVLAAKRAGMYCFGYVPAGHGGNEGGNGAALAAHDAHIFDDMAKLLPLIGKL